MAANGVSLWVHMQHWTSKQYEECMDHVLFPADVRSICLPSVLRLLFCLTLGLPCFGAFSRRSPQSAICPVKHYIESCCKRDLHFQAVQHRVTNDRADWRRCLVLMLS